MPKFLMSGNYVGDGVAGLLKEGGTSREEAARAAVESVGGTLECMYWAYGDTDVFGICDFPDDASAVAFSLRGNASGVIEVHTTRLLTAADLDAATKKSPSYRPPGG
jgi:uncharacterized protein with GYD domain